MDGVAALRMRTRGAESLYGGPLPGWRGKMHLCGPVCDPNATCVTLTQTAGERLEVLFSCEYSAQYNRFQIHSGSASGTPTLQLDLYYADNEGVAIGAPIASTTVAGAISNTVLEHVLSTPVNLIAGKCYVARYTVPAGTSLQLYCSALTSSGCLFAPTGWHAVASFCDSSGNLKGMGVTTFATITTIADGSKTFATNIGGEAGGLVDFYAATGTVLRAGFGHIPTEDRMVFAIRAPRLQCKGTPSNANPLSAYIYEYRGGSWAEVFKSAGKKHTTTNYPMSIFWFIPQGFMLRRGVEYVIAVGPTMDGTGSSTDCMQIGKTGQYSMFPRTQNVGQYGGISEERLWPAYYSGTAPALFSKSSSGADLCFAGVQYSYRVVPTVILP